MAIINETIPLLTEVAVGEVDKTLEAFLHAPVKIAVQKDGELTDISRVILRDNYGIEVPVQKPDSRSLVATQEDGEIGFLYARNKDICSLVASRAVDMAVVGTDRLAEDGVEDLIEVVESFADRASWPLVLATRPTYGPKDFAEIRTIVTKYPTITRRFLGAVAAQPVNIVAVAGGAEIYPYLDFKGKPVDAIIDVSVTGASLAAHGLAAWNPPVAEVYPVIIKPRTET